MSNTASETAHKPTWLEWGNQNMDHSKMKIADGCTSFGNDYRNDAITKIDKTKQIDELEYRKNALLNYQIDLRNKLAKCADEILEIDYEMRAINLEALEKIQLNRRL